MGIVDGNYPGRSAAELRGGEGRGSQPGLGTLEDICRCRERGLGGGLGEGIRRGD